MILEQLFDEAAKEVKALKDENNKFRVCVYILLGISILFGLMLIYFFYPDLD